MSLIRPDYTFAIPSFANGFSDTPEEDSLAPGGTHDAKNALLVHVQDQDGIRALLRKRNGNALVNPTAIADGKSIDGTFRFEAEGGDVLIVACDGTLYTWDGVDTFTAITGGTGFTAGQPVTFLPFSDNLFIMDGTLQLRYDGTQCWPVGEDAPATAPTLATAAGPGVTGTYEGFWVGYDPAMEHETSPSPTSSAVVFANQSRSWTLPAHSLPSNYTFWRVYCRRTDTSENNFFRAGEQAIGTTTLVETVSDAARRDIGPAPSSNDQPPVFAFAEEFKGYRLGVPVDSSDLYVSKILDPESQHPKDKFPVGGKGDTKPVRAVKKFGTECLVRKPTKTYRVTGDRLPFAIDPITSSLGAVSAESGVEIDGWWYDWDQDRGPYRTNTVEWVPLGDTTIAELLATVNRQALGAIQCAHFKTLNLVLWIVPTGSSSRPNVLLKYSVTLGRWLPPDTGLEYASLTPFTTSAGEYGVYVGDQWGRVYRLWSGETDGPPSGTETAAITGATSGSITADAAAFYTTGSGLAGMPILVVSPAGAQQWVRAASNTGTVITLDTTHGPSLSPVPATDGTWSVVVGAIDWYWTTPSFTGGGPFVKKKGGWMYLQASTTAASHAVRVDMRINRSTAVVKSYDFTCPQAGMVWGSGTWGEPWGESGTRHGSKRRMRLPFYDVSFKFSNYHPRQPVEIAAFTATADALPMKQVPSR